MRNESLEQNLDQSRLETCGSPMLDLAFFFTKEFILRPKELPVWLAIVPVPMNDHAVAIGAENRLAAFSGR